MNPTEALVSIDVNSGRATREHHIEDTALKTNLEAAEEIARQLRLRDLAGLIVIDFIDMEEKRNNRHVERKLKDALKHDRARIQVGHISHFGLMEMSRQRIRTGVLESSTETCPVCGGTGHVRSVSSVALQLLRAIEEQLMKNAAHDLIVRTKPDVALYVLNNKRAHLRGLEEQFGAAILIQSDSGLTGQQYFAIDRGGHARPRPLSAPARIVPDSIAPTVDEEDFVEESVGEGEGEITKETEASNEHLDHHGERSGGGRKRRRRGRRGRGAGANNAHPRDLHAPAQHSEGETAGEFFAESEGFVHPQENSGRPQPQSENAEPRKRRRRGRRGGRRNRRDRTELSLGETGVMEPYSAGDDLGHDNAPRHISSPGFEAPRAEHEPTHIGSEPAHAPGPEAAPKRRSTVREPAPMMGFDETGGSSIPEPVSQPEPIHEPRAENASEPDRPRRSGWWSRR
jgi:ribonuclease E